MDFDGSRELRAHRRRRRGCHCLRRTGHDRIRGICSEGTLDRLPPMCGGAHAPGGASAMPHGRSFQHRVAPRPMTLGLETLRRLSSTKWLPSTQAPVAGRVLKPTPLRDVPAPDLVQVGGRLSRRCSSAGRDLDARLQGVSRGSLGWLTSEENPLKKTAGLEATLCSMRQIGSTDSHRLRS